MPGRFGLEAPIISDNRGFAPISSITQPGVLPREMTPAMPAPAIPAAPAPLANPQTMQQPTPPPVSTQSFNSEGYAKALASSLYPSPQPSRQVLPRFSLPGTFPRRRFL